MVWVGKGANESEKAGAPDLVDKYLALQQRGDTPVMFIQQGARDNRQLAAKVHGDKRSPNTLVCQTTANILTPWTHIGDREDT